MLFLSCVDRIVHQVKHHAISSGCSTNNGTSDTNLPDIHIQIGDIELINTIFKLGLFSIKRTLETTNNSILSIFIRIVDGLKVHFLYGM